MSDEPVRRTPEQWATEEGYRILDPDGWRHAGDPPFDRPITREEFLPRMAVSTIVPLDCIPDWRA